MDLGMDPSALRGRAIGSGAACALGTLVGLTVPVGIVAASADDR